MPSYQVHRLREAMRQQFRQAPHTSGTAIVKLKDYEKAEGIEAESVYAAWDRMRGSERPLEVGDLLESEGGEMRICKYIGFEEAKWFVPEPPTAPPSTAGPSPTPSSPPPASQPA